MKRVLLISTLIVVFGSRISASSENVNDDILGRPHGSFDDDWSFFQNLHNEHTIDKRATGNDSFSNFHSKVTRAARIFSGISLITGLQQNLFHPDETIWELLNLELINLNDLPSFKKNNVGRFTRKIKQIKIPSGGDLEKMEKQFFKWNSMMMFYKELMHINNKQTFSETAENAKHFLSNCVDSSFHKETIDDIKTVQHGIRVYEEALRPKSEVVMVFSRMKASLERLEKLQEKMKSSTEELKKHKKMVENQLLSTEIIELLTDFTSETAPTNNQVSAMFKTMRTVEKAGYLVNGTEKELDILVPLLNSFIYKAPRLYLPGLPNGLSDLQMLSDDVKDNWIQSAIPKYNAVSIQRILDPLSDIIQKLSALKEKLSGLDARPNRKVAHLLDSFRTTHKVLSLEKDDVKKIIARFTAAKPADTEFLKGMENLLSNFNDFKLKSPEYISRFDNFTESVEMKKLKGLSQLGEYISFVSNDKKERENELDAIRTNISSFTRLAEFKQVLARVKPKMQNLLQTIQDVRVHQRNISEHYGAEETIKVLKFFDFLAVSESFKLSIGVFELFRNIRELQNPRTVDAILSFSGIVGKSRKAFGDLRKAVETITASKRTETSKRFPRIATISYDFGKSVEAVDSVFQAKNVIDSIENILSFTPVIKDGIKEISDDELKKVTEYEWGDVMTALRLLKSQMDFTLETPQNLLNLSSQFVKFEDIESVRIDWDSKMKAIERIMIRNDFPEVQKLLANIKTLSRLDMTYASYKTEYIRAFSSCKGTLSLFSSRLNPVHGSYKYEIDTKDMYDEHNPIRPVVVYVIDTGRDEYITFFNNWFCLIFIIYMATVMLSSRFLGISITKIFDAKLFQLSLINKQRKEEDDKRLKIISDAADGRAREEYKKKTDTFIKRELAAMKAMKEKAEERAWLKELREKPIDQSALFRPRVFSYN